MECMFKNIFLFRQLYVLNICRNGGYIFFFLDGFKENYYLKVFDLSYNCLNDEGVVILGLILCEISLLEFFNV